MSADGDSPDDDRALRAIVLLVLGSVVVGGAIDLYLDSESWLSVHVLLEATLMVVSGTTGLLLWRAWRSTSRTLAGVQHSLAETEAERVEWHRRADQALDGLGRAINDQFDRWELSPAERDVALRLLKGHGHKQIAAQTHRSEGTVRQHAVAVYGKSGQRGRAELAAYFLDSLMLPTVSSGNGSTSSPAVSRNSASA